MSAFGIAGHILLAFYPVWIGLAVIFALSIRFKRRLGLYGRLMDSRVGKIGLGIVLFWVLTAIFADLIITMSSAGPDRRHEERAARHAGARRRGPVLPAGRRQSGARRVQPDGDGQPHGAGDRAGRDPVRLHGRFHPRPAGGLFRRQVRYRLELRRQPGARLSGDPAVLPAGDAGDPRQRHPGDGGGRAVPVPDPVRRAADLVALQDPAGEAMDLSVDHAGARLLGLFRAGFQCRSVRRLRHGSEPAQHLRLGGVRECAGGVSHRARPDHRHPHPRLRGRGADARRDALVHHAVGDPAQCARAADRRFQPAHRLHDDPARHARLLRPRRQPGKPGLGHDHQRGTQAAVDPSASGAAAGAWR